MHFLFTLISLYGIINYKQLKEIIMGLDMYAYVGVYECFEDDDGFGDYGDPREYPDF